MPMNCPKCGQLNQAGSSFCIHCGQPLKSAVAPAGQSPQLVYGGFWKRLLASYLIDGFIISSIFPILILLFLPTKSFFPVDIINQSASFTSSFIPLLMIYALTIVLYYSYYATTTALFGGTVGKLLLGLKVVDISTGQKIGWIKSLIRHGPGYFVSSLVFYIGFIWIAFDAKKQGWHDKIAGTVVVDTKKRWGGWAIAGLIIGLMIFAGIMVSLVSNKFMSSIKNASIYSSSNELKNSKTIEDLEQILKDKEFQKTVQDMEKSGQLVSTVTAKGELSEILKTAKDFNSNGHLFKVAGNYTAGDPLIDIVALGQGSFPGENWTYWFRDPTKTEKDIFFVRFEKNRGLYMASDNAYFIGNVRGQDQGDIVPLWKINSDQAFSLAWEQAGKSRDQSFETSSVKADLAYDYLTNTRDLVFLWMITYSYKSTQEGFPAELKVYIDPQTGELINVSLKDLSKLR